jgi:hypothetical protein
MELTRSPGNVGNRLIVVALLCGAKLPRRMGNSSVSGTSSFIRILRIVLTATTVDKDHY